MKRKITFSTLLLVTLALGSPAFGQLPSVIDLANNEQDIIIYGRDAGDQLGGNAIINIGDFNGDGFQDLVVGAYKADGPNNSRPDAGEVYIIFGNPNLPPSIDFATATPDVTIYGADAYDLLGHVPWSDAVDLNSDSIDDIIIGATPADGPGNTRDSAGEAYIFFGRTSWPSTIDLATQPADVTIYGPASDSNLRIGGIADINGDGLLDLTFGTTNYGGFIHNAYIIFGRTNWPAVFDLQNADQDVLFEDSSTDRCESEFVPATGDINGDGIYDIFISCAQYWSVAGGDTGRGKVYVFFGGSTWQSVYDVVVDYDVLIVGADEDTRPESGDALSAGAIGDVNGDGIDDLILGAGGADGPNDSRPDQTGEAYVFFGRAIWPSLIDLSAGGQDLIIYCAAEVTPSQCPRIRGRLPDVNGDGIADIFLGSNRGAGPNDSRPGAGEAYIIYGNPNLPSVIDLQNDKQDVIIYGVDSGDQMADHIYVGDANGDGIDDLIINGSLADGPGNTRSDAGEAYIISGVFGRVSFQPGTLVINEVAWMGTQASANDEWIELYNTTSQDIDLTGWTLESTTDSTPSFTFDATNCSNLIIPAGGFFLLERSDDNTVSDIPADCIYTGSLVNSGESLALKDPSGTVIDTANGDGGAWPAGTDGAGSPPYASMERIDPLAPDTDANWATNNGVDRNGLDAAGNPINGTPKAPNSALPAAPLLVAAKRLAEPGPWVKVGEGLEYEIVLTNAGNAVQPDNPEPEFQDPIPANAEFVEGSLTATSGTASFDDVAQHIRWDGALNPGESVTLTFRVRVREVPTGTVIENQGEVLYDADGDGSNESSGLTDDPTTPEEGDPTRSPPVVLPGDANGDGVVDLRDAVLCAEGALALRALTELEEAACDVAPPSGAVDGRDVVRIAEIALGISPARATTQGSRASSAEPIRLRLRWDNLNLAPGERRAIRLYALEGSVKGLQLGPEGAIRFDPRTLRVLDVRAAEPYRLLAARVDNARGLVKAMLVRWDGGEPAAAVYAHAQDHAHASAPGIPLLELEVEAVGLPGMQTLLRTEPDLALDAQLQAATVAVGGGVVRIGPAVPLVVERFLARPFGVGTAGIEGYRFSAEGRGVRALSVEIFDLRGRAVLRSGKTANGFVWQGRNRYGERLANGVYLYVVTAYGSRGEVVRSEVRKLVLLRGRK